MNDSRVGKKGVKLTNENSSIKAPINNAAAFDKAANEIYSKYEEFKQRTWDLGLKFKSFLLDTMLVENKTEISKSLENEIINKLISLSLEINEDDTRPQGEGSSSICMLLMKCMLHQRDIINGLAYKIDKLEKEKNVANKNAEAKE